VTQSYAASEPAARHTDSRSSERALHPEGVPSVPTFARVETDSSSGFALDADTRSQELPRLPRRRVPATGWIALAVTLLPPQLPHGASDAHDAHSHHAQHAPPRTANMRDVESRAPVHLEATSPTAAVAPATGSGQTHTRSTLVSPQPESPASAADAPEPERRVRRARAKRGASLRAPSASSQSPTEPRAEPNPEHEVVQLGRNGAPILE
jgi:hypothetical protein